MTEKSNKKLIVIAGPTASGKTNIALQLAQKLDTAIISADSRQCYKELKIGVARPAEHILKTVPHYFIASHSITEPLSVGDFEQYALNKLSTIFSENDTAILTGGTGLYIKSVCEGLDDIPSIPTEISKAIEKNYNENGIAWLQNEIELKDKLFFEKGEIKNPHRLMRALAVVEATGKSILAYQTKEKIQRPFSIIKIALELPREILYQRNNHRVDEMMSEGLLNEVKNLIQYKNLKALQTVGYSELFNYLEGNMDLEKAIEEIKKNTRHYAKRQLTWFRKDAAFRWFNPNDGDLIEKIIHC